MKGSGPSDGQIAACEIHVINCMYLGSQAVKRFSVKLQSYFKLLFSHLFFREHLLKINSREINIKICEIHVNEFNTWRFCLRKQRPRVIEGVAQ